MTRSRSDLADAVDGLVDDGRVSVTETPDALIAYQLNGSEAKRVFALMTAAGWEDVQVQDEGGPLPAEAIDDEDAGITVRGGKPGIPEEVEAILTRHGFEAALGRRNLGSRIWVHNLAEAFETLSVRFAPWGDTEAFVAVNVPASPRAVVRVAPDCSTFPDDLGRWLLRDAGAAVTGVGAQPWRRKAVERLAQALADEVESDGRLLFRGPPVTRFIFHAPGMIEASALESITRAANWVFENPREVENRHILFAAEVARTSVKGGDLVDLAGMTGSALEGARIAYNFGVTQQSRDTLKALTDLRKAVGDETAKLGDATRSLITAIAGAVIANIGIIVARLSIAPNSKWVPGAAIVLGIVLALYVAGVIVSGAQFLRLQATLREEWRSHLYRFLSDAEYRRMVTDPVGRAERAFWTAAAVGWVTIVLMFGAVYIIAHA